MPRAGETLWFELTAAQPPQAANGAAVALLNPAMLRGEDMTIDAALSPRLLFHLTNGVQTLLRVLDPRLKAISVDATLDTSPGRAPTGRVGTGFSAGVDSFAMLALYGTDKVPAGVRLTDLAVFDVGRLARRASPRSRRCTSARLNETQPLPPPADMAR